MMSLNTTQMITGCGVCNKQENLQLCSRCKVIQYCSRDHQVQDRDAHKRACNAIDKKRKATEAEDQKLRNAPPGDIFLPERPFETCIGHFWGVMGTRDYMRARFALVEAIGMVNTRHSVEQRLEHLMDMLRLCHSDNMGVRDIVPGLLMRLGRDQKCYDFLKFWQEVFHGMHSDHGDENGAFLHIRDADSFEDVDLFCSKYTPLSYLVPLALLKTKLLLDLLAVRNSETSEISAKVPREILNIIQHQAVRTDIIEKRLNVLQSQEQDLTKQINALKGQIRKLYETTNSANRHLWRILLKPGTHLESKPEFYSAGDLEEAQLILRYSYATWVETPGALEVIKVFEDEVSHKAVGVW